MTELIVRGFPVRIANKWPSVDTAFVTKRLDAALALLEEFVPRSFHRMRSDVREFVVLRYPCRGAYFPGQRAIMTELTFLARAPEFSEAQVAASILHEATHARIYAMLRAPTSHDAPREERICREAELRFGAALPHELGAPVITRAVESLALSDEDVAPVVDWRRAQLNKDVADLESLDMPRWMKRAAIAVRKWREGNG
ncbi:MAG: hypothetical protein ACJ79K_14500 [Gemmatimonadaceae bacterium]